jgi:hypothetical protein
VPVADKTKVEDLQIIIIIIIYYFQPSEVRVNRFLNLLLPKDTTPPTTTTRTFIKTAITNLTSTTPTSSTPKVDFSLDSGVASNYDYYDVVAQQPSSSKIPPTAVTKVVDGAKLNRTSVTDSDYYTNSSFLFMHAL